MGSFAPRLPVTRVYFRVIQVVVRHKLPQNRHLGAPAHAHAGDLMR